MAEDRACALRNLHWTMIKVLQQPLFQLPMYVIHDKHSFSTCRGTINNLDPTTESIFAECDTGTEIGICLAYVQTVLFPDTDPVSMTINYSVLGFSGAQTGQRPSMFVVYPWTEGLLTIQCMFLLQCMSS